MKLFVTNLVTFLGNYDSQIQPRFEVELSQFSFCFDFSSANFTSNTILLRTNKIILLRFFAAAKTNHFTSTSTSAAAKYHCYHHFTDH